jgi:hypothetical protein
MRLLSSLYDPYQQPAHPKKRAESSLTDLSLNPVIQVHTIIRQSFTLTFPHPCDQLTSVLRSPEFVAALLFFFVFSEGCCIAGGCIAAVLFKGDVVL